MGMKENIVQINARIEQACERSKRDVDSVKLLAVTKSVGPSMVEKLQQLGIMECGENRVQQARKRVESYPNISWHLIGSLQTNKVKYCQGITMIHSLDRVNLAQAINCRAQGWNQIMDCLIQVNISREDHKHGVAVEQVLDFATLVVNDYSNINLRGLMGMAPNVDAEQAREFFQELAELQNKVASQVKADVDVLSMGMSNDFEVAIEEGSTLVRIGTALFEWEV